MFIMTDHGWVRMAMPTLPAVVLPDHSRLGPGFDKGAAYQPDANQEFDLQRYIWLHA